MRGYVALFSFLLLLGFVNPGFAQETPKPETIVGKMAFKFARGITNVATSVVELPKQSYLSVRDQGGVGYVVGPLKGIGMTVYRALIGTFETAFFLVPQPGYYDPMVDPDFVWDGWQERSLDHMRVKEAESAEPIAEKKGE